MRTGLILILPLLFKGGSMLETSCSCDMQKTTAIATKAIGKM